MKHGEARHRLKRLVEINRADISNASKALDLQTKNQLESMANFCKRLAPLINYTAAPSVEQLDFVVHSLVADAKETLVRSPYEERRELREWAKFINECR